MKPRTTVILIAVLALCVGYVVLRHTKLFETGQAGRAASQERLVFAPAPSGAKRLTIVSAGGEKLVFLKQDTHWRIVEPIQAKARDFRVGDIVDALVQLKYERSFGPRDEDAVGPEITGLDKPRWTVTLLDEKGATYTLQVGKPVPLSGAGRTYVRPAGQRRVYVVNVDFTSKLARPLREFRDTQVLDIRKDDVVRIKVEGRHSLELRKDNGSWSLVAPVSAAADKEKVEQFIGRFAYLTVREFVADRPESLVGFGLDERSRRVVLRVWVESESKQQEKRKEQKNHNKPAVEPNAPSAVEKSYALILGSRTDDEVFAMLEGEPTVFKVDAELLQQLQPKPLELRDRHILRVSADQVDRVRLVLPDGTVELLKSDKQWRMSRPFEGPADAEAVASLLNKLDALRAEDFRDDVPALAEFGLEHPAAEITLYLSGKGRTKSLLIGAESPSGQMRFVKSASATAVAVLRSSDIEPLLAGAERYWHKTLAELPENLQIEKLDLQRPDGAFELRRDEAGNWSLSVPLQAPAERANVEKILDRLAKLTAAKFVALGPDALEGYVDAERHITVRSQGTREGRQARKDRNQAGKDAASSRPPSQNAEPQPERPAHSAGQSSARSTPSKQAEHAVPFTMVLHVVRMDEKAYAWLEKSRPLAVGEFAAGLYDDLAAELRDRLIWKVKPREVQAIEITAGGKSFTLRREKDRWRDAADPYVEIDAKKVQDYLNDIKQLRAEKFASYKSAAPAAFGLNEPQLKLKLQFTDGSGRVLTVSKTGPAGSQDRYASCSDVRGVFVLSHRLIGQMRKTLKDFIEQ